ncbi:nicotinate phosphoribosyltransferase [Ructibacterium gallinarum]|uniref:Nicotinate phosphoribosyltransferase n=1 Tax=Ructibacterium gallinarum TaxID=2779355 RepID=A0A9D5RBJ6_9FIRM|nr:nicotinate phosphoribosyltransferase [Ructibacterium gallinarum]MBE5040093.1 nicotinate phosphoribosyltransferase [Ructibacterium gallinarum]
MNYTMLTDFYELTMANGYLKEGMGDKISYFDMYFRQAPDGAGVAIMAGVEQLIAYLENLKFEEEDIAFLRQKNMFDEDFLTYLSNFKFACDVWAIPEGTPIFPNEPIVTVRGPLIQAQFVETMILLTINHQSLIATKSNRIVRAAGNIPVMEFGSRRAQGYDGAIYGARAAYIGGVVGTACTISDQLFSVPALGTMAHSWVQSFDTEYKAFLAYAKAYPNNCTLLIDTYNVLKSGLKNAIRVFDEVLRPLGITNCGVRIDSGDITYLTKKCRKILDDAGWKTAKIVVSNSLDEYIIRDILLQGAKIDSFGVGERLITSKSEPVFGGVYKMVAVEENGKIQPKIKISENVIKITNPYFKKVYRLYSKETGMAIADVLTTFDETIDTSKPYEIFDPRNTWKRKTITNFEAVELQVPIFQKGNCVYHSPSLQEIRAYCEDRLNTIWDEVKRFENPHEYYVDLSQKLWDIRYKMLSSYNF